MIIDITRCGYAPGYVPRATEPFFNPFFAAANVAFRREALQAIGGFDPLCLTGEDIDVSIRLAAAGWELWHESAAVIQHMERFNLPHMLKQWFGYGRGLPRLYRKHVRGRRLQVYMAGHAASTGRPHGAVCLLNVPFFCRALAFLTSYHLLHVALFVLLIGAIAHSSVVSLIAAVAALTALLRYAGIRFEWRRPLWSVGMFGLRYLADTAFVAGGLLSGLRQRALILTPTRTR